MSRLWVARRTRALAAALIALGGALWLTAIEAAPGTPMAVLAAPPSLTLVTDAHYDVRPSEGVVIVTVDITATNHLVDTSANRYFFDKAYLAVQPGASDFALTARGLRPRVTVAATEPSHTLLLLRFGTRLAAGASMSMHLTFRLVDPGTPPERDIRISDALVAFSAWAFASDSTPGSTVTVSMPDAFDVEFLRGELAGPVPDDAGRATWASGPLASPTTFEAAIRAVRSVSFVDSIRSTTVRATTARIRFRGWRDDPGWLEQASRLVLAGAPAMADAIGRPWPIDGVLDVDEALIAEASVSAGRFDPADPRIEIAYYAGPEVVLHELAHAWFNGSLLADRWADEAFASLYAERAAAAIGQPIASPELTPELEAARQPLNAWGPPGSGTAEADAYGYAASLALARAVAARAGPDGLARVWAAIEDGRPAYDTSGETAVSSGGGPRPADWRSLLDLLEEQTGARYGDLWLTYVLRPEESGLLYEREAARRAYAALVAAAGDWTVPEVIRASMRAWQFDEARAAIVQATVTLAARERLRGLAASLGLTPPDGPARSFEAGQLDVADDELAMAEQAAAAIAAAGRAHPAELGFVETVGLIGTDPATALRSAAVDFEAGRSGAAATAAVEAETAWRTAADVGRGRVVGALAGLLAAILLIRLVSGRGWARQAGGA